MHIRHACVRYVTEKKDVSGDIKGQGQSHITNIKRDCDMPFVLITVKEWRRCGYQARETVRGYAVSLVLFPCHTTGTKNKKEELYEENKS